MSTIFLIDDDEPILTSVSMMLEDEGYKIQSFTRGGPALDEMKKQKPDLIVLDIKMPEMDGFSVLQAIKQIDQLIPTIMLTSKEDETDEVLSLRLGADDYIRKPFSQRLLLERIKTLLRRVELFHQPQSQVTEPQLLQQGDLTLDLARYSCAWKNQDINLTVTEFLILKLLMERPGHVRTRDQIMDNVFGENIFVEDRTIDSHIKRLRQKFKAIDPDFNLIETLYGVGYKFKG